MSERFHTLRFVPALLGTNLKATVMLRGAFVMQVVFMALNNLTFFIFWWVLMRRVPDLRGWRLAEIELLFGIVAVGVGSAIAVAGGVAHLGRFIDEGQLDTLLTQPKPVLVQALGMRSNASGIGDVMSGLVLIALSGHLGWRPALPFTLAILSSALVFVACGVMFFSLAFWLGKIDTFARQLWELVITFALYPEPLFGSMMRLALFTIVPAGFVGYLPARLVQHPSVGVAAQLVVAAALYLMLAAFVFDRGLRRYSSGARFSTFG
jgi:ABC-2 type transport system permease protein